MTKKATSHLVMKLCCGENTIFYIILVGDCLHIIGKFALFH